MRLTRKFAAVAMVTVAGVVLIQPAAFAGPVGSGWTEHSPAWNAQIQSKGVITSYPSSTNNASGPAGSYARAGGLVHTANGPQGDHYFKYGVYGTLQTSGAEHQWRNVHFYRK